MSDIMSQRRTLVEALYAKTIEGNLKWGEGYGQNSFKTDIGNQAIEILRESDENRTDYTVNVYDGRFNVVESFNDIYFNTLRPVRVSQSSYYAVMSSLFDMASRNSTGADKVVGNILDQLNVKIISDDESNDFPF